MKKEKFNGLCDRIRKANQSFVKAKEAERTSHQQWVVDDCGPAKQKVLYHKWHHLFEEQRVAGNELEEAKKALFAAIVED